MNVVLLDIDGVVFKSKPMLHIVKGNITRYVRTYLQKERRCHVSETEAGIISENLYKHYGHTLRGLQHLYGPVAAQSLGHEFRLQDFNNFVYDEETINLLYTHLLFSDYDDDDAALKDFCDECYKNDVKIGVFSNAPSSWCTPILQHLKVDVAAGLKFTSSHPLFGNRLKPDVNLYNDIVDSVGTSSPIMFIDDSPINLSAISEDPRWIGVHFKNSFQHIPTPTRSIRRITRKSSSRKERQTKKILMNE